ncbi:DUF6527 family protein [Caballeronia sp. J97]|uniref:DUF6527 family protein n=1 Tax=Caballeronia sp. J97 TaxID=2805429 RepID=UPI0039EDF372
MRFVYQAVDRLPKQLSNGVVYHSHEFEVGAMLCACGCGHRVSLLVPDSHQITSDGTLATIRPSIAVCDAPCKSHFYITAGHVEWLPAFSDAIAASVMRNQISRHADRDANAAIDAKLPSYLDRIRAVIGKVYGKLRSLLRK